ncbi:hypothetical protein TCSYLVIO_003627 [Trypanosoma cruzi]|nr:hypothetical protein TCSYLVIO_003627 [Trypanosoma cruzi]
MEEQRTGNTQRLPPPAAGVTAGAQLFVTHRATPTHEKNNQREAKEHNRPSKHRHAAARRLILVPSSHPLRRWRTSPRTDGGSPVDVSTAAVISRQLQLPSKNPSAHVPGTQNATPLTGRTPPTSRPQRIGNIQITGSRPPSSRDAAPCQHVSAATHARSYRSQQHLMCRAGCTQLSASCEISPHPRTSSPTRCSLQQQIRQKESPRHPQHEHQCRTHNTKKKKQRRSEPTRTPPHARHKASPIIFVVQPRRQQRIQGHTQPLPSPLPETQGEEYTEDRTRHKRASRAAAMRSVPIHSPLFCVGKRLRP